MQKKSSKLQKKRWIMQTIIFLVACLVFITYRLYISGVIGFKLAGISALNPFAGYDTMYQWATKSFYRPNFKSFALILAGVILFLPLVAGRFFCGWICPYGTLQDYFSRLGKKAFRSRGRIGSFVHHEWINRLEFMKYGVLALIILSKGIYGKSILSSWDPWTAFANLPVLVKAVSAIPLAYAVLSLTLVGAIILDRFFCRFFCPLGALQGLVSLIGLSKIAPMKGCTRCENCRNTCPVGINLAIEESSFSPECITCLECVEYQCEKGQLFQIFFGKRVLHPITYLLISLFIFSSSLFVLRQTGFLIAERQMIQVQGNKIVDSNEIYRDGVFTGQGKGFSLGLEVRVQVKKGKITGIDVVKHQETWGYYEETFEQLIQQMLDLQSTDVDVITGATYTGNGIKEAVENALEQAKT